MILSDVCLSVAYIGPKSRTYIYIEAYSIGDQNWHRGSPRHTWLGHHFQGQKVKGQGHQAALLTTAVLARQAAAAVGVGTCWMGNCCYVAVCSAAQGASTPMGEERGGGISWRPPAYSLSIYASMRAAAHAQADVTA